MKLSRSRSRSDLSGCKTFGSGYHKFAARQAAVSALAFTLTYTLAFLRTGPSETSTSPILRAASALNGTACAQ